ncbi:hypothetical protein, partial [Burkholderia thailandensis]|uniref:hypothetical protein n=1 Tax=Burkholderia thailandensis TaxID=57975 RepID=UPI003F68AC0A|nr:thioesterase [Burkholderia thailandensis]
ASRRAEPGLLLVGHVACWGAAPHVRAGRGGRLQGLRRDALEQGQGQLTGLRAGMCGAPV